MRIDGSGSRLTKGRVALRLIIVSNILDEIVAHKRIEIESARRQRPESELEALANEAPAVRDFRGSLAAADHIGLIAEVKRASPSAGTIREDFQPVDVARIYQRHGASCISVLTDQRYFQGQLADLTAVRAAVSIPVMRKDFILDRYQVLEARAAGADCVLLIAECLEPDQMSELYTAIRQLGMQALIEIYDPDNLQPVLELNPDLLGINNRNLKTFVTDLDHTIQLRSQIPDSVLLVSESGIRTQQDVCQLRSSGVQAILVGESLMRATDIGAAVDALMDPGTQPDDA